MTTIPCVGAVVFDCAGRLLLVQRANPPAQGTWSLPGGRLEVGESAEQGVVREVREETGLRVRVSREVGSVSREAPGGDEYDIRDFLCVMDVEQDPVAGDDASDAAFVSVSNLDDFTLAPGLVEALTEWQLLTGHGALDAG